MPVAYQAHTRPLRPPILFIPPVYRRLLHLDSVREVSHHYHSPYTTTSPTNSPCSPRKIRSLYKQMRKVTVSKKETGWPLDELETNAPNMQVDEEEDATEDNGPLPL